MSLLKLYYNEKYIRYDFLDEPIGKIKQKLYAYDDTILNMYPPFIKLTTSDNVLLREDSYSAFLYTKISPTPLTVNITNITEDPDVKSLVIVDDSEALTTLRSMGYNLSDADLQFYKQLLNAYRGDSSNNSNIENYMNTINGLKNEYRTLYDNIYGNKYYNEIYKLAENFNLKDYIEDIYYNGLSIDVRGNNITDGVNGRLLDLDKVFNIFELSKEIPYIAIGRYRDEPIIKVHNSLKSNEKLVNSWVLNEKKKANVVTYKKVKGLMLKVKNNTNWITVNILYNGIIEARINYEDELEKDLGNIKRNILKSVQFCIDKLNILSGVFFHSKKLNNIKDSQIIINNISGESNTNFRINKNNLRNVLNSRIISENLFNLKETIGSDIMSMFYTNHYKSSSDTKGVIVNVKDNNYKLDSSVINVFSAINSKQIQLIIEKLILTSLVANNDGENNDNEPEQRIREKSKIKDLKKKGIATDSKNCQKDKQPNIEGDPLRGSYTLEYNDVKYVCPNQNYPFPGFTNKNIVCCFKKDQRGRPNYIANTNSDSLELMLTPSNKIIKINDTFKTYPLKIVSEYIDGFNESNSVPRYYYLSSLNELVAIKNTNLINKLEDIENIWLEPISLSKLVNTPPKQICSNIPKLSSKSDQDLNKPCKHHTNTRVFGYTNNSYPCCFTTNKDPVVNIYSKKIDITREHILKHDKLLQHQRIGELHPQLDNLFNKELNISKNSKFYRMGVISNANSLYNAILLSNDNSITIQNKIINNAFTFRKYIEENYGNVPLPDIIKIIEKLLNIKIFILERSRDDSLRLLCTNWYNIYSEPRFTKSKSLLLFKTNNTYELLINVQKSDIIYMYPPDSKLVEFLNNFEHRSCIIDDKFPEKYPYTPMLYIKELLTILNDIIGQVVYSDKVIYAITKKGFLIPVKESDKIDNLKSIDKKQMYSPKLSHQLIDYIKFYSTLSKKLKIDSKLINVIVDDNNAIVAATTSFGPVIPITPTPFNSQINLPKSSYKYYRIDNDNDPKNIDDISTQFYKDIQKTKMKLYNTKKEIAKNLTSEMKETIISIIKNTDINRFDKIKKIHLILLTVTSQLHNEELDVILYQISNDILNDNVENLLLNNIVISEFYNPDELVKRDSESILENVSEIKQFFKN